MYTPTPEQIATYGLARTQGRFYEVPRAGHFRANNGRSCDVELRDGTVWNACFISVDEEGTCRVLSAVNQSSQILVFTSESDDFCSEQSKILSLTIWPDVSETIGSKESTQEFAERIEREERKIGEFTVPIPKEAMERIQTIEEMGHGEIFRTIAKFLMFVPQYLLSVAFCALMYYGHIFIAAFVLIMFFDLSMVKSFTNFVFKAFKK